MMLDEPIPCPFCGEDYLSHTDVSEDEDGMTAVICEFGAQGPARETERKATEAWNERKPF